MFNAPDGRYPGECRSATSSPVRSLIFSRTHCRGPVGRGPPLTRDRRTASASSFIPLWVSSQGRQSRTPCSKLLRSARLVESTPIVMADGSSTTIREARRSTTASGQIGWSVTGQRRRRGLCAEGCSGRLRRLLHGVVRPEGRLRPLRTGAVTGHTHVPKQGINSRCLYMNCGFECPAVPDVAEAKRRSTSASSTHGHTDALVRPQQQRDVLRRPV